MEMTEMMKRYEKETGMCCAYDTLFEWDFSLTDNYIAWLEAKAESYDRLMSGGANPKELANILQAYVACNDDGRWSYFWTRPISGRTKWTLGLHIDNPSYRVLNFGNPLLDLPPCACHWTDSLIVPDGLEEAND